MARVGAGCAYACHCRTVVNIRERERVSVCVCVCVCARAHACVRVCVCVCIRSCDTGHSFDPIFMKFTWLVRVHSRVNPIVFGNNRPDRTTDMGENVP